MIKTDLCAMSGSYARRYADVPATHNGTSGLGVRLRPASAAWTGRGIAVASPAPDFAPRSRLVP